MFRLSMYQSTNEECLNPDDDWLMEFFLLASSYPHHEEQQMHINIRLASHQSVGKVREERQPAVVFVDLRSSKFITPFIHSA